MIQIPLSHNLNSMAFEASTCQNGVMAEVIGVTEGFNSVGKIGELDYLLLNVVDETLRQVFRDAGIRIIYNFLENSFNLKLEEIAGKPEVFSACLERLLGSGAPVIEKLILKNLCCKFGLEFEEKDGYVFSDYIRELTQGRAGMNER